MIRTIMDTSKLEPSFLETSEASFPWSVRSEKNTAAMLFFSTDELTNIVIYLYKYSLQF